VGITLSNAQKAYIDAAVTARGLCVRVEIRVQDYRTFTDGPFDAAASIAMGEHVGRHHYSTFAGILYDCVRPDSRGSSNSCRGAAAIRAVARSSSRS
jgi:cyclopropane-fatty-acyl-phospholipid synthase